MLFAFAQIAAAFLDPFQAAIGVGRFVGLILIETTHDLGEKPVHEAKVVWQWARRIGTIWAISNQEPAK